MMSGCSKCSKHVSCCSADHPARSLCSHLRRLLSQDQPLSQLALPVASGQFFLSFFFFLTVKSGFSPSWSFPGVLLSWEPPRAAWIWGRKGLWIKAKESQQWASHHANPQNGCRQWGPREEFGGIAPVRPCHHPALSSFQKQSLVYRTPLFPCGAEQMRL